MTKKDQRKIDKAILHLMVKLKILEQDIKDLQEILNKLKEIQRRENLYDQEGI